MSAGPWRVLLLEDSPLEAALVTKALAERCQVTLFSDGAALLERLAREVGPELLILDCVLPGLSGLEVCRFVRQTKDRVELPILMLTANNSEEIVLECLEAGANDFVTKPFRAPEVVARVATLAEMSRTAAAARQRERERAVALLRDAKSATERMQTQLVQRDRHIGILGHDLRNPLSAILMAAESLERGPDVSGMKARRIKRSAARMALMIKDILDFTRGQLLGSIPTVLVPTDLDAICADVIDELSVANPGREIRLEVSGDVIGSWDPDRLLQAISNLVGNALEHSESVVTMRVTGGDTS
ncbi:MAG TPA: hybrid sensor histidine kinase/response regulator, partial [Polyangia bacterium]|nr:hybrid sensor histidine kinase/response regulator [Polyangia bacterium]